jgi:hypothetical protein
MRWTVAKGAACEEQPSHGAKAAALRWRSTEQPRRCRVRSPAEVRRRDRRARGEAKQRREQGRRSEQGGSSVPPHLYLKGVEQVGDVGSWAFAGLTTPTISTTPAVTSNSPLPRQPRPQRIRRGQRRDQMKRQTKIPSEPVKSWLTSRGSGDSGAPLLKPDDIFTNRLSSHRTRRRHPQHFRK